MGRWYCWNTGRAADFRGGRGHISRNLKCHDENPRLSVVEFGFSGRGEKN
jgi:hypothetical protein